MQNSALKQVIADEGIGPGGDGSQAPGGAISDLDLESAKQAFDPKFWGSIATAKAAVPHLHAGGSITLTSGFLARRTVPGTFVKTSMNAALEARQMFGVQQMPQRPGMANVTPTGRNPSTGTGSQMLAQLARLGRLGRR